MTVTYEFHGNKKTTVFELLHLYSTSSLKKQLFLYQLVKTAA